MEYSKAKTATEWVFVSRSVNQLPDGQAQALRCMARAEVIAEGVSDWLTVGLAWYQDFDDLEMAKQCLTHAEAKADHEDAWERIAEVWVQIGCIPQAVKCHQEDIRFEPPRFVDDIDDPPWGFGTTSIDWSRDKARGLVADAKEQIQDNLSGAIRSMVLAEHVAEGSQARIPIAKSWAEYFRDLESAARCLDAAEEFADDCYESAEVALLWKNLLSDHDRGVRCLREAEQSAGNIEEWHHIADIWKRDFEDMDAYYLCLDAAAEHMEDFSSEEFLDFEKDVLDDLAARDEAGLTDLGVLESRSSYRAGIWQDGCLSNHREGSNARCYSFTLIRDDEISIFLTSGVNNFLYLIRGAEPNGALLDQDHSAENEDDEDPDRNIAIVKGNLTAGTYTVEAATHRPGATGIFALAIYRGI